MQSAHCPQCGGHPEFDEEGGRYACYFCCDTGRVSQAVADAYDLAISDAAERFAPRRLGIFPAPMAHEYDWDEPGFEPAPGHRLFTGIYEIARAREVAERDARRAHFRAAYETDDIPF